MRNPLLLWIQIRSEANFFPDPELFVSNPEYIIPDSQHCFKPAYFKTELNVWDREDAELQKGSSSISLKSFCCFFASCYTILGWWIYVENGANLLHLYIGVHINALLRKISVFLTSVEQDYWHVWNMAWRNIWRIFIFKFKNLLKEDW